jgi:hypothetical protein
MPAANMGLAQLGRTEKLSAVVYIQALAMGLDRQLIRNGRMAPSQCRWLVFVNQINFVSSIKISGWADTG